MKYMFAPESGTAEVAHRPHNSKLNKEPGMGYRNGLTVKTQRGTLDVATIALLHRSFRRHTRWIIAGWESGRPSRATEIRSFFELEYAMKEFTAFAKKHGFLVPSKKKKDTWERPRLLREALAAFAGRAIHSRSTRVS